mmetsp:Transcript_142237/g.248002  ORF Transcript_142237/g.248002 Transcript_142237/m.248002 type:complete len:310 (-) Transcript_142237:126-1055(-)
MPFPLTKTEEDFERLDELIEDSKQEPGHQGGRNMFAAWCDANYESAETGGKVILYNEEMSADHATILANACKSEDIPTLKKVLGITRLGPKPKSVEVDLGFKSLTPKAVEVLMKELPANLENFSVNLKGNQLMMTGVKAVAAGLPKKLRILRVDLGQNKLGAAGVEVFMKAVPDTVQELTLGVSNMRMGLPGVKAIADNLPPGLEELYLDICDGLLGDDGCIYLSRRLPKTLKKLNIWMRGDQGFITNRGHWIFDRLINDPLNPYNLPELTVRNYKNVRNSERDCVQQYEMTKNTWELQQRWLPNENVC